MSEEERPPAYNRLLIAMLLAVLFVVALGIGYVLTFDCIIGCPG